MGRKSRKKNTFDHENDNSDAETEEQEPIKPLWDLLVSDAESKLLNFTMEYEKIDSVFEWLSYGTVIFAVEDVLFCKSEWLNFNITSAKINNVVYDYITGVIEILDLKNKPLLEPEYREYTIVNKVTKKESVIFCVSPSDRRLDNTKYFIYEEPIDSDIGVTNKLDKYESSLYIYLNYKILKEINKYYIKCPFSSFNNS
jgi:hypothetical protein